MENKATGGITFIGAITLIFISAKVFGFIDWSWWWVFSPMWISFSAYCLFFMLGYIIVKVIIILYEKDKKKYY